MPGPPCRIEIGAGSRKIYQPVADGVNDQFGGLVDAQRIHDVGTMNRHGVRAKIEHRRNLLVGFPIHDHLQDFEFAGREMFVPLPL